MQDEAERIAAGLHPADQKTILGDPDRLSGPVSSLVSLCLQDLATSRTHHVALTPLGLAVREIIRSKDHG